MSGHQDNMQNIPIFHKLLILSWDETQKDLNLHRHEIKEEQHNASSETQHMIFDLFHSSRLCAAHTNNAVSFEH